MQVNTITYTAPEGTKLYCSRNARDELYMQVGNFGICVPFEDAQKLVAHLTSILEGLPSKKECGTFKVE